MRGVLASNIMTRTTLDLDASILAQLRRRARAERKSMGQLASERLAASLGSEREVESPRFSLPVWHMGEPKVDLDDKEELWRALEGPMANEHR
jgi:hypothetical protein